MRYDLQRNRQKAQHMSASAVASEAQYMLQQLSLPIQPTDTVKARRERAIRRAGVSHAKGVRLWYRQSCTLAAHEFLKLAEAYKTHVRTQERLLERELEQLRARIEAHQLRADHYELDLASPAGDLGAGDGARR